MDSLCITIFRHSKHLGARGHGWLGALALGLLDSILPGLLPNVNGRLQIMERFSTLFLHLILTCVLLSPVANLFGPA